MKIFLALGSSASAMSDKQILFICLRLCVAVSAESLVRKDFVESGQRDQDVDGGGHSTWEVIAYAVAEDFESPV